MVSSNYRDFGWRGRWIGWRNHVLASARFQRFAARFPLTRPVARRRARTIFNLVAGFTYSQILAACIQTKLLDMLADGPLDAHTIAARSDLPLDGAERLLRSAASLGLVEPLGMSWSLGADGAALRGNPGIADMVAHHHLLYADLADPMSMLRRGGGGGALSAFWTYAESPGGGDDQAVAAYSTLMGNSQSLVSEQALDSYRFDTHRRLLDVGGGEGLFVSAVAVRVPRLELAVFDLPAVVQRARSRAESASLNIATFGGDFFLDALPNGYDLISLIRVLHDHDDAAALTLLRNVHRALPAGGRLFIAEPMTGVPGAEAAGAYFEFYLLAMGSGRPRSPHELVALLHDAGFSKMRVLKTAVPLTTMAIIAAR